MSHATAAATEAPRTGRSRPRRIRNDALAPDYHPRAISPQPADRQPPHMLLRRGRALLLITSWPSRRRGLTDNELAQIADIERWLSDTDAGSTVASAAWLTADGLTLFEPQSASWTKRMLADRIVLQLAAS